MTDENARNLIEKLIHEVRNRPVLWNKYHDLHNNRATTDQEWLSLAQSINKPKDFVKHKWKNLRDQFKRECKRVLVPPGETLQTSIKEYSGRWLYFEQLAFLKDTVQSRPCYHHMHETGTPAETIEFIEFDDESLNDIKDSCHTPELASDPNTIDEGEVSRHRYSGDEIDDEVNLKRKASEEPQHEIKCKRMSLVADEEEIDDDLHFFKSLLPFMRKLSPVKKLMIRNEIQNIFLRENLCDKCS